MYENTVLVHVEASRPRETHAERAIDPGTGWQ
jgi:hypothetical protein